AACILFDRFGYALPAQQVSHVHRTAPPCLCPCTPSLLLPVLWQPSLFDAVAQPPLHATMRKNPIRLFCDPFPRLQSTPRALHLGFQLFQLSHCPGNPFPPVLPIPLFLFSAVEPHQAESVRIRER